MSLISFGFTLHKFQLREGASPARRRTSVRAREFALLMISIGLVMLVFALQNRRDLQALDAIRPRAALAGDDAAGHRGWVVGFVAVLFRL